MTDEQAEDRAGDEEAEDRAGDEEAEDRAGDEEAEDRAGDEEAEDRAGDEEAAPDDGAGGPANAQERLDALQEDIAEVRRRVQDDELDEELAPDDRTVLDEGERSFMDEDGAEGPGDDTIAPPG